jgi:hypothetical protein
VAHSGASAVKAIVNITRVQCTSMDRSAAPWGDELRQAARPAQCTCGDILPPHP